MSLTASSAGAIVHSVPLTKVAVTGCYQVRAGVFKKNISTQQSTWMVLDDGGGVTVELEEAAIWRRWELALGGGLRLQQQRWAAVAV
jgi:hypothetical protein